MFRTLDEAHGTMVTRKQVIRELREHGIKVAEFDAEFPMSDMYDAGVVLEWMGY